MLLDCPIEALGVRSQGHGAEAWMATPEDAGDAKDIFYHLAILIRTDKKEKMSG